MHGVIRGERTMRIQQIQPPHKPTPIPPPAPPIPVPMPRAADAVVAGMVYPEYNEYTAGLMPKHTEGSAQKVVPPKPVVDAAEAVPVRVKGPGSSKYSSKDKVIMLGLVLILFVALGLLVYYMFTGTMINFSGSERTFTCVSPVVNDTVHSYYDAKAFTELYAGSCTLVDPLGG